jgi:hypothetical protein
MSRFFSVHGTEAAMSSKKQQKKQRHTHKLSQDMQDALADIVLNQVDRFWRNHGEGFENTPQEGKILKAMLDNMHKNPDPDAQAGGLAQEVWMSDLEVALQRAKEQRRLRVPIAREWVTKSLPLWLNELRNGDIGRFPSKAEFVQHFRDPMYDFDRGIISDKELEDIFVEYQRSNFAEILRLNREAQSRETVLEATTEFLADVVGGAVEGTAISDATNDVLRGATRLATVFTALPRFFDPGWRQRALQWAQNERDQNRDRPSPWLWPEVAYKEGEEWDPMGWKP